MRKKAASTVLFSIFLVLYGHSQTTATLENTKKMDMGISVQAYPAGIIPTLNLERYNDEQSSIVYRLGVNIVDRQDFSDENDEETGGGFGASMGYRKHYPLKKGKLVAGLNMDIWNLWIDWENDTNSLHRTAGTTYTLVVQPWLETGYFFNLKNSASQLAVSLGFGREVNAITNGKDVEQGWIASLTLYYLFSLKK